MKSTGNSAAFREARLRYRAHLRECAPHPDLAEAAATALRADKKPLKRTPHQCVVRGIGENADLLFKFYSDRGLLSTLRPSRARRAFAAARTLFDLSLPTPDAVGYLEKEDAFTPYTSCLVMRFIPDAVTLRQWIKTNHRHLSPQQWTELRIRVRELWLDLARAGIYHDDTKALNILIRTPTHQPPQWWWIDPESVHPGQNPTRRQLLRNLVQLNGSLRTWVPESERLAFLHDIAAAYPWLRAPRIEKKIRHWTHARLQNEIRTRCGP